MNQEAILGISAFYHDSAAALIIDGEIISAVNEERFTRIKYDASFPVHAVSYVLDDTGIRLDDLTAVVFYDKPYIKFERLLETYHAYAPAGLISFLSAIPVWIKEKLFMKNMLMKNLEKINSGPLNKKPCLLFPEHHLSHAASAFYPSPFETAAILTIDGVGEWATTTIGKGEKNKIQIFEELAFPHSLGLLYSAFTYYCGFRVNSGEYKLMGLAPYGNISSKRVEKYKQTIFDKLVDLREDGSLLLNMAYFNYATGLTMCDDKKWEDLFGIPKREPESAFSQEYMDMALAIQQVAEKIILRLARTAKKITGADHLVLAGGVALNCVANGKLAESKLFKDFWVQPAAGDAGGALGAALAGWYIWLGKDRKEQQNHYDHMKGTYLGPEFTDQNVFRLVRKYQAKYTHYKDFNELIENAAKKISQGKILGWFQGRMEWGPRALGNRSILGDPRDADMQKRLNLKIKYREGFRPFAPSVLAEDVNEYFVCDKSDSPYMQLVVPVQERHRKEMPEDYDTMEMYERLYQIRSNIPAVTHVDFSARIQTVHKESNHRYWSLINAFKKHTGCGLLVNTSFNVRGEPIVCSPEDAYVCFMRTDMDYLVINQFLFKKQDQPRYKDKEDWRSRFDLD